MGSIKINDLNKQQSAVGERLALQAYGFVVDRHILINLDKRYDVDNFLLD